MTRAFSISDDVASSQPCSPTCAIADAKASPPVECSPTLTVTCSSWHPSVVIKQIVAELVYDREKGPVMVVPLASEPVTERYSQTGADGACDLTLIAMKSSAVVSMTPI